MIFRLFCFLLIFALSLKAESKWQHISWEEPEGWKVQEVGYSHFPYVFNGPEKLKISLLLHEYRPDAIWVIAKVYRDSLGLPLLTEEELSAKGRGMGNDSVYFEFIKEKQGVSCAFYRSHGFLWVLKLEAPADLVKKYKKDMISLASSLKPNKDFQEHIKKLQASKENKDVLELAEYLDVGLGVKKDQKKAFETLLELHEKGFLDATYRLAAKFLEIDKVSQAFSLLQKGVDGDHLPSIKKMAALFLDYKNDTIEAHQLLKKAANKGDTESMFYLGSLYTVDPKLKDPEQAYRWIKMAADKGSVQAYRQLGVLYRSGFGVKRDPQKALELLELAARKGDMTSFEILADIYRNGEIDGKKDYTKCREYLMKAVIKGSYKALLMTAELYLNGEGVEKDPEKAISLLKEASKEGIVEADLQLGDIFSFGTVIERDEKSAFTHYKKAAEAGDKYGMFKLALAYLGGKGCKKDGPEAVKWLKRSAKLGYSPAVKALKDSGF